MLYRHDGPPIQHRSGEEKEVVLQMIDIIKDGLENKWTMSAKKKKKKIEELEVIRSKLQALDESQVGLVLEASASPGCLPRREAGFGLRYSYAHREIKRQLSAALRAVDEQTTSVPPPGSFTAGDVNDSDEGISIDDSILAQATNISDESDLSEDSESVVVTTSNLETDDGPLGVSITTWRRHKHSETPASDSNDEDAEGNSETEGSGHNSLEEVSISFGEGLVIRATTRTKTVRFVDIKPSAEDNIRRAKELLRNAKLLKNKL